jgi:dipeptidyl aminopeptidase/acylaminoacyl peptidase
MSLIHGEDDDIVPISQSKRLFDAMQAAGAQCEFKSLPGEMHSFTLEGWLEVRSSCMEFVRRFVPEGSRV